MNTIVRISEAASLAMHAMGYLATRPIGVAASSAEMAGAFSVSKAHLSKVLQRLQRARLVTSRRGPRGGFFLADDPGQVTLLDVYQAIDGEIPTSTCLLNHDSCPDGPCIMGDLLHKVSQEVHDHLEGMSLSDLAAKESFAEFRRLAPANEKG